MVKPNPFDAEQVLKGPWKAVKRGALQAIRPQGGRSDGDSEPRHAARARGWRCGSTASKPCESARSRLALDSMQMGLHIELQVHRLPWEL